MFSGKFAVNAARSKRNNGDIRNEFNELCNEKMRCAKVHKKGRIKNIEGKIINFAAKLFGCIGVQEELFGGKLLFLIKIFNFYQKKQLPSKKPFLYAYKTK